jgi:hypothetical protein
MASIKQNFLSNRDYGKPYSELSRTEKKKVDDTIDWQHKAIQPYLNGEVDL